MRVLLFGTYDRLGGRNQLLADALRAAGARVERCHEPLWSGTDDKLAAVAALGGGGNRLPAMLGAALRIARAQARLASRSLAVKRADVVLVGSTGHLDLPLAKLLARRLGAALVFDPMVSIAETAADRGLIGNAAPVGRALRRVERALLRLPDRVLMDTRVHARALDQELGLRLDRTSVVPVGAHPAFRAVPDLADRDATAGEPLRVTYFGQYIPLHGVDTILRAAHILSARDDIRWVLVGRGQTLGQARALACRLGIANVRFVDTWLPQARLADEFVATADVCLGIFGSGAKASRVVPQKVYAALAAGRPVVTGDTPAAREFLQDGVEAVLVPPGSASALARAIAGLADDSPRRSALGDAARRAYDERFSRAPIAAAAAGALEAAMAGADAARPAARPAARSAACSAADSDTGSTCCSTGARGAGDPRVPLEGPRHRWRTGRLVRELLEGEPGLGMAPILDAGCGDGTFALELLRRQRSDASPVPPILSCDIDRVRVERARARYALLEPSRRPQVFVADLSAVPLADATCGAVVAGEVLEHVADDGRAAAELARVLAASGTLAFSLPAGERRFGRADRRAGHLRRYGRAGLLALLSDAGLEVVRLRGWGVPFGRIYDSLAQAPALALAERAPGTRASLAFLARGAAANRICRGLFRLDEVLESVVHRAPALEGRASGWMGVARKPSA